MTEKQRRREKPVNFASYTDETLVNANYVFEKVTDDNNQLHAAFENNFGADEITQTINFNNNYTTSGKNKFNLPLLINQLI